MAKVNGKAKTTELNEKLAKLLNLENITGSEKQVEWARNIIKKSLYDVLNANNSYKATGREKDIEINIDDRLIQALTMHTDAKVIIENKNEYDFHSNKMIIDMITIQ